MADHLGRGRVRTFDPARGLGEIELADDGEAVMFHCVDIADGSREIDPGTEVTCQRRTKFGRPEARHIHPR